MRSYILQVRDMWFIMCRLILYFILNRQLKRICCVYCLDRNMRRTCEQGSCCRHNDVRQSEECVTTLMQYSVVSYKRVTANITIM